MFTGRELMDSKFKDELLYRCSQEYFALETKKEKTNYIDFFNSKITPILYPECNGKLNRKSILRVLKKFINKPLPAPRGAKKFYSDIESQCLKQMWPVMGFMCGKRMKPAIKNWILFFNFSDEVNKKLLKMSAATIDRILRPAKVLLRRKNNTSTVPVKYHIKQKIPLRDKSIKVDKIGLIETDTVVHCGDYIWGTFAHTSTVTDLYSGWTEARATLGKNAELVVRALEELELSLPMLMVNLFFDNGIEFINHTLVKSFSERKEKPIVVARGRSGKSNDQCHIEQKNNVFVRQLFGYDRVEDLEIIKLMNELYSNEWSKLFNYFYPQMKLVEKDRVGSKCHRKYDEAKTPYERLLESGQLNPEQEQKLIETKAKLNPVELQQIVQKKLSRIVSLIKNQDNYKEAI